MKEKLKKNNQCDSGEDVKVCVLKKAKSENP